MPEWFSFHPLDSHTYTHTVVVLAKKCSRVQTLIVGPTTATCFHMDAYFPVTRRNGGLCGPFPFSLAEGLLHFANGHKQHESTCARVRSESPPNCLLFSTAYKKVALRTYVGLPAPGSCANFQAAYGAIRLSFVTEPHSNSVAITVTRFLRVPKCVVRDSD